VNNAGSQTPLTRRWRRHPLVWPCVGISSSDYEAFTTAHFLYGAFDERLVRDQLSGWPLRVSADLDAIALETAAVVITEICEPLAQENPLERSITNEGVEHLKQADCRIGPNRL
jgi:hypothetical protein